MKKAITLLAFLSLVISFPAGAQHLGFKGGLNFTTLNLSDVENAESDLRLGYHAGIFFNIPVSETISFQPELLYSTKGSRTTYEDDLLNLDGESTLNLNYIEVPLLGVLNLGEVAQLNFGPYIAFLSTASYDVEGTLLGSEYNESEELDQEYFRNVDYGLAAGLALNFNALQVGARYAHGLVNVEDSDEAEFFIGDGQNRSIQAYIALRLGDYDK